MTTLKEVKIEITRESEKLEKKDATEVASGIKSHQCSRTNDFCKSPTSPLDAFLIILPEDLPLGKSFLNFACNRVLLVAIKQE